jgi:hypothetical protein
MLYRDKDLPELFYMKHRHDDQTSIDYENQLFDKNLSPYIYQNDMMNSFLKKTQPLMYFLFDQVSVLKNMKNYIVDKYK